MTRPPRFNPGIHTWLHARCWWFVLLISTSLPCLAQAPLLYEISLGEGKAFLLGGTEVQRGAENWFSGEVEAAVAQSSALVVQLPPADPLRGIPPFRQDIFPSLDMHPVAIEEGYGNLAFGDYMDVSMGERSVVESQRLDLNGNWYRPMQPWVAYYYFSYSFWDMQDLELENPETRLLTLFRASDKDVVSLFPDRATFFRYMGSMPDTTQTQFFQSLYNIMDWQRDGEYDARFGWVQGEPASQFLDRHRQQTPLFYDFYYRQRNRAIAEQVAAMLENGGTWFIYLDVNHTLGEDSLQTTLEALGAEVRLR